MNPSAQPLPASHESTGVAIARRIVASLGCAVLLGVLAAGQPFVSFWLASVALPGVFGNEYQLLAPLIAAVIGVVGSPVIGLVAGAAVPNRLGVALSLSGLALFQIATLLYLIFSQVSASESAQLAFLILLAPAIVFNLMVAAALWLFRWRSR